MFLNIIFTFLISILNNIYNHVYYLSNLKIHQVGTMQSPLQGFAGPRQKASRERRAVKLGWDQSGGGSQGWAKTGGQLAGWRPTH